MITAFSLVLDGRRLRHASGAPEVVLGERPARVLHRLMQQPAVLLDVSVLIAAVWPNPDDEPDSAEQQVRQALVEARRAIAAIAGSPVRIRSERRVGWAIEEPFRRPSDAAAWEQPSGSHEVAA